MILLKQSDMLHGLTENGSWHGGTGLCVEGSTGALVGEGHDRGTARCANGRSLQGHVREGDKVLRTTVVHLETKKIVTSSLTVDQFLDANLWVPQRRCQCRKCRRRRLRCSASQTAHTGRNLFKGKMGYNWLLVLLTG